MKFYPWRSVLPLLILWLAFGLRLYHLDFQSIWWDEGHSIFVASQPITQIPTLPAMDVHPPAYFSLLHLWLALAGQSEFALRFLSVVFSLLTVALLHRFAHSILYSRSSAPLLPRSSRPSAHPKGCAPLLTSLLAALSPLYVAYAQEVRSYAMITFLALASTFILWHILLTAKNSAVGGPWSAVTLYIFFTAACLYTHYFTIFLLLFHNLAWLVWVIRKNRSARLITWVVSQVGILLLFAPQLFLALRQITSYTNPNLAPPSLSDFILHSWQAYTVGLTLDPQPTAWGMFIIAIILVFTILFQLHQIWSQPSNLPTFQPSIFFLLGWFLIPLAAYFLVLQRQPSFEPRYLILVTPALFLILGSGVRGQGSDSTSYVLRLTPHASRFILLAIFIFALHSYYTNETYFKDDSAGVADWLAAETTANDLVYVDVPHPFHYYAARGQIAAPTRYLFVDIHTAADTLTREAAGRDRLFWITWRGSDTDPRGVIPFLAQKYGQRLGQRDFRGYHVEWFSLPQAGAGFSLPAELPPVNAAFGDVLRLDGAAFGGYPPAGETTPVTHPAWATLHFTLLRDTDVDYKVSLRLRGEDGHLAAQVDKDLLNDRHFRTSAWPPTDPALNQAINVYTLPLAAETPPGSYRLEVVVYNAQPPYPGEGVSGLESEDGAAAVLGHITVIP
ncbi:MAG: glycosyltransferase family 39 protein [Anaerolineae bacterium]|nr:glycosyltransferase family 39 protein [Anaerolineae bacterium]